MPGEGRGLLAPAQSAAIAGYGEPLQRRLGVFGRDERALTKDSHPLSPIDRPRRCRHANDTAALHACHGGCARWQVFAKEAR